MISAGAALIICPRVRTDPALSSDAEPGKRSIGAREITNRGGGKNCQALAGLLDEESVVEWRSVKADATPLATATAKEAVEIRPNSNNSVQFI